MIQREMKLVSVSTYTNQVDSYGQLKQGIPAIKSVKMCVKTYKQTNTSDIRFTDVELIGLTKESLSDMDVVTIDSKDYNVVLIINDGRYNQVFMKRA